MAGHGDFLDLVGRFTVRRRHQTPDEDVPDDRLHSIIFECLTDGIADDRVVSLMHVMGWNDEDTCMAAAGKVPSDARDAERDLGDVMRSHGVGLILSGMRSGWMVAVGAARESQTVEDAFAALAGFFDDGSPVCLGDMGRSAHGASSSIRGVLSALRTIPAVPDLPRVIRSCDVLPERALLGDEDARHQLYETVYSALREGGPLNPNLPTVDAFLRLGGSLDATARHLKVHPNTVRYRLKRIATTTGWDATDPREAYVLRTALAIGRIYDASGSHPAEPAV
ncbi:CdaR family transcriptional regulator [uncultured Bifidobacterium sp.]|uniref:PucR family transcriptional regulator n=1 Tax=uncultured Bifidobacterium sp. TaxID=165187 RepID=UPI002614034A|nr:PucR family transcriptional regulator [uncultured Bifidobacterium sp.]